MIEKTCTAAERLKRVRRRFKTPEDLWQAACEYFEWADENPLYEEKAIAHRGAVKVVQIPKHRPFTVIGFCLFHGLGGSYLRRLRNRIGPEEEEYHFVIERIYSIIWVQKFELASVGLLNASFIARELGLGERTSIDMPSPQPARVVFATPEEMEDQGISKA